MLSQHQKEVIFHKLARGSVLEKNAAIKQIYEEFQPVMYKKLRYQYQDLNEWDAQDIVQNAFLKLATTTSKPKSPESLVSWIVTIVENTALDLFRRAYKKYENTLPGDDDMDLFVDPTSEKDFQHDMQDCFTKGLVVFSQRYPQNAAVISMSMDELRISQIAELISRTEAATRQYIYESKRKLKPFVEHCI